MEQNIKELKAIEVQKQEIDCKLTGFCQNRVELLNAKLKLLERENKILKNIDSILHL